MTVIRWAGFEGENRAIHPKLLAETLGTLSRNQKPGRGDLRPWKAPLNAATAPAGRKTIYRMGRDTNVHYWLSWTGRVHVARVSDATDTTERTAYTGDGEPKWTDNTMALTSAPYPTSSRPLGLPVPSSAPLVNALPVAPVDNLGYQHFFISRYTVETRLVDGDVLNFEVADLSTQVVTITAVDGAVTCSSVTTQLDALDGLTATNTASDSDYGEGVLVLSETATFTVKLRTNVTTDATTGEVTETFEDVGASTEVTQPNPTLETCVYVYTWVNDLGWESAPSLPSTALDRDVKAVVEVSGFDVVPSGNHQVNRIRVYRTQTGSDQFMFLREVAYGTSSTTDDNRATGETLASLTWQPPPGDLKCLTALWNGMLAGISGNSVRFCEAYVPYAWPVEYDVIPPNAKPVALGVFGQSLLVLTDGRPLLVSGSGPNGVDQQPLDIPQSCVAPDSVVSMGTGVAWASDDGLCFYGSGGAKILTAGLLTREDWQALKPSSIIGQMYEGLYLGSYDDGSGRKGFFIDPGNPKGVFFLDTGYEAMHLDEFRDQLFVLDGANIKQWDAGAPMTVKARSKVYRQTKPTNFACAEVVADNYPVTFRMYTDGSLRHTQTVANSEPFRLPSGYRAVNFQLEVESTHAVQAVLVGQSMAELTTI